MWRKLQALLLILAASVDDCNCRRERDGGGLNVRLKVPRYHPVGERVVLVCNYDLGSDTLYAVKWYKGNAEFYRFTPKELPAAKIFQVPGLEVDEKHSNATHLFLRRMDLNMSGKYSCEVTTDAPDFTTDLKTEYLTVVALPTSKPILSKLKPWYAVGDLVNVTCYATRSRPAANLTWYINNRPAHLEVLLRLEKHKERENFESSSINLELKLKSIYFINRRMILRCTATIYDKYAESTEITVSEEFRPKISSVVDNTSPGTYRNIGYKTTVPFFIFHTWIQNIIILMFANCNI